MFSIRLTLLFGFMLVLIVYAWRDWFVSLCGLILLTVVLEHPEMPKNIMGIQGLNPWNIVLAGVFVSWVVMRRAQGLRWDLPRPVVTCIGLFLLVTFITFLRGAADLESLPPEHAQSFLGFATDHIINPVKLMLPGLMLYDGCRTRRRLVMALLCLLALGVGYALLVIKCTPLSVLTSESQFMQFRHRINRDTGLHANDMAMLLVGYFWAILSCLRLGKTVGWRLIGTATAAIVFLAFALCFSRAGYISFAGLALLFGLLRWRWLLPLMPVAVVAVALTMPSVTARLGMGLGVGDAASQEAHDLDEITSGRATKIWPPVFEEISASPVLGWGRKAMLRTRIYSVLAAQQGGPGHPHNAYLEILLDAGLVGLIGILPLYGFLFATSARMFRSKELVFQAVGGTALAPVAALLITGLSSQSLFPTVSMFGMWCASGLLLRLWVVRRQADAVESVVMATGVLAPNRPRWVSGIAR